jgi:uncharacterized protein (DUF488 family)
MCTIYTARVGHKDSTKTVLDTTVKSGSGLGLIFAPTWEIVMGVKQGRITQQQYTDAYLEMLRERYRASQETFLAILAQDQVVVTCYCRAGAFCHRHIVVDVLEKIAAKHELAFARGGEVG